MRLGDWKVSSHYLDERSLVQTGWLKYVKAVRISSSWDYHASKTLRHVWVFQTTRTWEHKKHKMRKPWGAHLQKDEKSSSSIPAVIIKWRPICIPLNVMETLDWWKPHIFLAKSCLNCFQKNMCSFFFLSFFWGKGMQNKQCYTSIAFIPTRKPNWKYTLLPRAQTHYCNLLNVEPL